MSTFPSLITCIHNIKTIITYYSIHKPCTLIQSSAALITQNISALSYLNICMLNYAYITQICQVSNVAEAPLNLLSQLFHD